MATTLDAIEDTQIPCLLNRRIGDSRFLLERRIGSGGYSVVYLATDLESPRRDTVAVKCLLRDTSSRKLKADREILLHRRVVDHPGVVKLYQVIEEDGLLFLVLQYCPDGDLFTAITETKIFLGHDELIKVGFLQLLDTVQYMHSLGIYHRDLKPENVLCVDGGSKLLLADFGLATESVGSTNFGCGSYFYMTPECLAGCYSTALSAYSSRAADIWALGVILVNLICSRSPWKCAMLSDPSFRRYTRNRHWLHQMLPLSASAFRFIDRIFAGHGNNSSLVDLRAQFVRIETFYMSDEELACADKTARLVAKEWIPDTPVDDIGHEDLLTMTEVDDIDEKQLFEDSPIQQSPNIASDLESLGTITPTTSSEITPVGKIIFSSLDEEDNCDRFSVGSLTDSDSSGSDSDFPITPETKPIQATEPVPDIPDCQDLGGKLELPYGKVCIVEETIVT